MIAYVNGIITVIQEDAIIVDVNGIGYEVFCANPFSFQSSVNEKRLVHTYQHVKEDVNALYGFDSEDEKFLFTKLISVSGIGPKSAINILATVNVPQFIGAVEQEDEKFLTQFPGVGKKTARQIILDLKGKLTEFITIDSGDANESASATTDQAAYQEAEEALQALGYSDKEIRTVMQTLLTKQLTKSDEIIRKALALLMKQ